MNCALPLDDQIDRGEGLMTADVLKGNAMVAHVSSP